jgi:hypothetical protein
MTFITFEQSQKMGEAHRASARKSRKSNGRRPEVKYKAQMQGAGKRGIEWHFTFETWWEVWRKSGKWFLRGTKKGQYVMCRKQDQGPYSPGNVYIGTTGQNALDVARHKGRRTVKVGWYGYIK